MPEIHNADDWWHIVDLHWEGLIEIASQFMDMLHPAYDTPGDATSEPTGRDILGEMEYLKEGHGKRLVRYFQAAWALAPDSYAYSHPTWGVLCDLCSEEWALHVDDNDGWFI